MGLSALNSIVAILLLVFSSFFSGAWAADLLTPAIAGNGISAASSLLAASKPAAGKANNKSSATASSPTPDEFTGNASWYGVPFHGRKTACGEIFDMNKLTAAHKSLSFQTRVLVESPKTGKSVVVKVNDRGPYAKGRVLDLAREAFRRLGSMSNGVLYVECMVVDDDDNSGSGKGAMPGS